MNPKTFYVADVVPLTRIPLSRNQAFSYSAQEELPPGTLVSVPLFYRNIEGVVIACYSRKQWTKKFALKPIRSVLAKSFLTSRQLKLAKFISEYYICPLGIVLKSFVPKRVKARKKIKENIILPKPKKITLTPSQKQAIKKLQTKNYKLKTYLYGPSGSGKTEVYIETIKKLEPKKQALILLPDLTLTPQAIERYGAHFESEKIAVLHSKISKGEFFSHWEKIRLGEAKIIIGSRMALFAPFQDLGIIILDEEHDISFKQWDMNPRYDARRAAEEMSEDYQCPLVRGSSTPEISSWYHATEKKDYTLLVLSDLPMNRHTAIEMIDMKKERWIKNYSPVSKKLESEIAYALKHSLQTILFVNRQGMSSFSVCAQCKTVLRCPTCDRALVYDRQGFFYCLHCSYRSGITPHCAACNGIEFRNVGIGTQKVEKEIAWLFPSARIARADSQSLKNAKQKEKLYRDFKNKSIDILVGTQMISMGWDLPSVALVGIIDADNMLSAPDFSTPERAWQHTLQAAGRVNRPGSKFPGQVLLQTFHPEQKFFHLAAEKDFQTFYEEEIKERKLLRLPPFFQLVKLIFQDASLKKVSRETQLVYERISHKISRKEIVLFPPHDPFVPKIRGRFRKQILLKLPANLPLPKEIRNVLYSLPAGWIVDMEPISII